MARRGSLVLAIVVAASVVLVPSSAALADQNDPLYPRVWANGYQGSYVFRSSFDVAWMKEAVRDANATIGHSSARNPDFHSTAETDPHDGHVRLRDSSAVDCGGSFRWLACAGTSEYLLWFSSEYCWRSGANHTCFNHPDAADYDLESVALNEVGHINGLVHHQPDVPHEGNADVYGDAVVQAYADRYGYGHQFEVNRALRWADIGALKTRYGSDPPPPCPPCPTVADQ